MGQSNLALRPTAIPFRSLWYDNTSIGNRFGSRLGDTSGDVEPVWGTTRGNSGSIRFTRPLKGDIIEARLTINALTPFGGFADIRFAIGTFDTDGITPITPSEATIRAHQKILFGNENPLNYGNQDNIYIDGLNLTPLIPKRGEVGFNEDGFILYTDINGKTGTNALGDWTLYEFKMDCSVQIGVL